MEAGSTTSLQLIFAEFWRFADSIKNSGKTFEDSFLGAFTAILASRDVSLLELNSEYFYNPSVLTNRVIKFFSLIMPDQSKNIDDILNFNFEHQSLRALLNLCGNSDLSNSDLLDILGWINSHASISFVESITPEEIANLMINIANIKHGESVLDPAMGSAGLYRALRRSMNHKAQFIGVEINVKSYYICCLYSYLLRDSKSLMYLGSAFSYLGDSLIKPIDVVICNPPIKKIPLSEARHRYGRENFFQNISSEMSLNFVELGLQSIKPGGRALFLINMKPLFATGEIQTIRKHWIESGLLKTVISLPSKLLAHTGLKCAILVFEKSTTSTLGGNNEVKFVKSDDLYTEEKKGRRVLSNENINEITNRIYHINDGVVAKKIDVSILIENDFSLVPDQYLVQEVAGVNLSLSKIWKPLGEIADIFRGGSFSNLEHGNEPIIQGRDLRVENLNIRDLECKDFSAFKKQILRTQSFDILLQRIGENPAAFYITTEEGYAVADTVFVLRFKSLDSPTIEFICQFINSSEGSKRIKEYSTCSVIPTQSIKSIKDIKVPVPDPKVVTLVRELNEVESALRNEYEKATQLRVSLFGGFDKVDLSTNLRKVKLASQILENSLSQKDDINYKVRNLYPFPLAYPYRNIYVEREFAAIYDRQMKYGEHIISFLASIGLSIIFEYKEEITESLNEVAILISNGLSQGLSPGHWRSLLQLSCKKLKNLKDVPLADDFASLWFKGSGNKESEFAENTNSCIVQELNNYKHGRGPNNTHEFKESGEKQSKSIKKILEDIEFLSQCEIVRIDSIDTEWTTEKTIYYASLLKGDHPAFEKINFTSDKRMSIYKLYIRYNNNLICLYPFLSCLYNPNTKKFEIFSFDKRSNKGINLKSFDSGTSIESKEIDTDLGCWIDKISVK